jgi:protein TonB
MRIVFFIISSVLISTSAFPQNETSEIYFPREQIVFKNCNSETDKNLCLSRFIEKSISEIINSNLKQLRINDDTLTISVRFSLIKNGRVDNSSIRTDVSNNLLGKETYKSIESLIKKLPRFEITNRKSEQYRSEHIFDYKYTIEKADPPYKATLVESEKKYEGGTIVELPVYPGCENLSYSETFNCFSAKIKQHIKENFIYPEEAFKNNIQGLVRIRCIINKEGKIEDIKTKGGAYILQREAIRIIELLPDLQPAKQNGKPVKIPYSVPITFKLSKS